MILSILLYVVILYLIIGVYVAGMVTITLNDDFASSREIAVGTIATIFVWAFVIVWFIYTNSALHVRILKALDRIGGWFTTTWYYVTFRKLFA